MMVLNMQTNVFEKTIHHISTWKTPQYHTHIYDKAHWNDQLSMYSFNKLS